MRNLLLELYRRDRTLTIVGGGHLALCVLMLAAATVDDRQVLGVNVWVKPIKFAISIAIYAWTLAWILPTAPGPRWTHALIRWGVSFAMLVEMALIALQSARGKTSHFNEATSLDGAIFSTMGLLIILNTCLEALLLALYFRRGVLLAPAYLWGIRWGLLLGIFAAVVGGIMVSQGAHTVGAKDGGPGLWLLNWSTSAGDLRIAHALGLHALQILPLLGWLLSGRMAVWQSVTVVTVIAVGYSAVACLVLLEALAGQPNMLLNVFSAGA
jgi:hypothetical protein